MNSLIPIKRPCPFLEALQNLLKLSKESPSISVKTIFSILEDKGYAALFIILSLPFCLPIQIPGVSTPFGLLLAFLAIRFTFSKSLWCPEWILNKEFSSEKVGLVTQKTIKVVDYLKKITWKRLPLLTQNPIFKCINGMFIFLLALLLLLPLPIPFTNMLTAFPIFCLGIGLLEEDGVFILIGYFLTFVCFLLFIGVFFLGKSAIHFFGGL